MNESKLVEIRKSVFVPRVGNLDRVELRSACGELLEVHYRLPAVASTAFAATGESPRRPSPPLA
jgi:hypothetical protein